MIGPFEVPGYHVGDCRELLRQLPDGSINCCVTSPPYWGLRDYGTAEQLGLEETPDEYVHNMVAVFSEVRRALRPDGTLWMNLGDTYFKKSLAGVPWRVAFALQADGWYLRSDIIWHKPNPMPESVTDRPTKSHEYLFLLTKSPTYTYDAAAIAEDRPGEFLSTGAKNPRFGRPGGMMPSEVRGEVSGQRSKLARSIGSQKSGDEFKKGFGDKRNRRSVWTIVTEPTADAHFATFPQKLVEPCILAGCPLGGVVLDPFGGSGTTGRVAEDLGRQWLMFDLNPQYAAIAKRKTAQVGLLGRLAV